MIFMEFLYGTTNNAKLESMRRITGILGIDIIGLKEIMERPEFCDIKLPEIDESGSNPLENAKIKAMAYYKTFGIPVFSCDSGLYFEEVAENQQPGTHVRRVGGKELSDSEMIEYYGTLADCKKEYPQITSRYIISCMVDPKENESSAGDGETESTT